MPKNETDEATKAAIEQDMAELDKVKRPKSSSPTKVVPAECPTCQGTGLNEDRTKHCPDCGGSGKVASLEAPV